MDRVERLKNISVPSFDQFEFDVLLLGLFLLHEPLQRWPQQCVIDQHGLEAGFPWVGHVGHRGAGQTTKQGSQIFGIYRPEYYGLDSDDKGSTLGKADIILAKHRSGGTGEVRLRFVGKYARFENDYDYDMDGIGSMSPNSNFDSGMGSVTIDSKMNTDDDVPF